MRGSVCLMPLETDLSVDTYIVSPEEIEIEMWQNTEESCRDLPGVDDNHEEEIEREVEELVVMERTLSREDGEEEHDILHSVPEAATEHRELEEVFRQMEMELITERSLSVANSDAEREIEEHIVMQHHISDQSDLEHELELELRQFELELSNTNELDAEREVEEQMVEVIQHEAAAHVELRYNLTDLEEELWTNIEQHLRSEDERERDVEEDLVEIMQQEYGGHELQEQGYCSVLREDLQQEEVQRLRLQIRELTHQLSHMDQQPRLDPVQLKTSNGVDVLSELLEDIWKSMKNSNPETDHLREENERLKDERLCKICVETDAEMAFLPCGHLSTCQLCAQKFYKCPICRTGIRTRIKVYI